MTSASPQPVAFGDYIITRRIARGGMAEIYRARHREGAVGTWSAVKMMRASISGDPVAKALFRREGRIASLLQHPHIVPVTEAGHLGERAFLAMAYVPGQNLSAVLETLRGRALSVDDQRLIVGTVAAVARALDYAHRLRDPDSGAALDIVHRDISPGNVMVDYDGHPWLLDFGVARVSNATHQTQAGTLRGKFAYMSPEQVVGEAVGPKSDIFALGTLLYELLTGCSPFLGDSPADTLDRVQRCCPEAPDRMRPSLSPSISELVSTCLRRAPSERPDGAALAQALWASIDDPDPADWKRAAQEWMARHFEDAAAEDHSALAAEEEQVLLLDLADFAAGSWPSEHADVSGPAASDAPVAKAIDETDATVAAPQPPPEPDLRSDTSPAHAPESTSAKFRGPGPLGKTVRVAHPGFAVVTARQRLPWLEGWTDRLPAWVSALAVTIGVFLIVSAGLRTRAPEEAPPRARSGPAPGPTAAPSVLGAPPVGSVPMRSPSAESASPKSQVPSVAAAPSAPSPEPTAIAPSTPAVRVQRSAGPPRPGFLSVGAKPWARIYVDGVPHAEPTPVRRLEVLPGRHLVRLENPKSGRVWRRIVRVRSNQTERIHVDLTRSRAAAPSLRRGRSGP